MEGHKDWLKRGFDAGVFLLAGSLPPDRGGCVLVHGLSRDEARARVNEDPFVAEGVVEARLLEITPSRVDDRLTFLLG